MAEQRKFNAKVKGKGTDNTGYTEDHARAAAASLGGHTLAIVDLRAHTKVTDEDGNETVMLAIDQLEPVPPSMEDDVRELMRALYRQRPEVQGQEVLKGTADGPNPEDALGQTMSHVERGEDGEPDGIWDGNPDSEPPAGLSAVPDQGPEFEGCDFPDCSLEAEHEGDHAGADDPRTAGV